MAWRRVTRGGMSAVLLTTFIIAGVGCESQAQREKIASLTSQVGQLQKENAGLKQQVESLTRENEDLKAQLKEAKEKAAPGKKK